MHWGADVWCLLVHNWSNLWIGMEKADLGYFKYGVVLCGREDGLGVLETVLLGFLFTAISQVDRYYSKQGKIIKPV